MQHCLQWRNEAEEDARGGILERHFKSRFLGINSGLLRLETLSGFLPLFFFLQNAIHKQTRVFLFGDFLYVFLKPGQSLVFRKTVKCEQHGTKTQVFCQTNVHEFQSAQPRKLLYGSQLRNVTGQLGGGGGGDNKKHLTNQKNYPKFYR